MIYYDCINFIGDDDCNRCTERGLFYGGCERCENYTPYNRKTSVSAQAGAIADECLDKIKRGDFLGGAK